MIYVRGFQAITIVLCFLLGNSVPTGWAQVKPSGSSNGKLYVTSWFGGVISVVDIETKQVSATISVGVQDHNVFLSPDQKSAWVTN